MFNKDFIAHLQKEIIYLREQNEKLNNMIVALSNKKNDYIMLQNKPIIDDKIKKIEEELKNKQALNESELKQKELAQREFAELLGNL